MRHLLWIRSIVPHWSQPTPYAVTPQTWFSGSLKEQAQLQESSRSEKPKGMASPQVFMIHCIPVHLQLSNQ